MVDWLAGKRVKGTNSERTALNGGSNTPSPDLDFSSSSGWTLGSGFTISSGTLNANLSSQSGSVASYDTGASLSNSWVMRFEVTWTTLTQPSASNYHFYVGMRNATSSPVNAHDAISFVFNQSYNGSKNFRGIIKNNQTRQAGTYSPELESSMTTNTTYYCEIIRNSETLCTFNQYTDNTFTSISNTGEVNTLTSGTGSLRYIWIGVDDYGTSVTYTGSIDNIKLYDGVTSVSLPPNLQDGTIFEETDTNKAYIWSSSSQTWTQL